LVDSKDKLVVCDRHLLGEIIYAKVKKTPSQWKDGDYDKMLAELNEMGAQIFVVWEYKPLIEKRHKELGETFITPKEGMRVQGLFLREAKRIAEKYPGIIVYTYRPTANGAQIRIISKTI